MNRLRDAGLASYAVRGENSASRTHSEREDLLRGPFEVDRERVIQSTAFRRLEHKTQVFTAAYHDHFRTRLTHSIEVANIARTLAVGMGVNEPLAEVIALSHDLGHPPFGHAGESGLREAMADCGGFNHNTHALRVVDYLEHPFPQFRGINLTNETRRGLALHETRYDEPDQSVGGFEGVPGGPSVEAQIASLSDRVAVVLSDLEDAIGARLVSMDDFVHLDLWRRSVQSEPAIAGVTNIHAIRRPVLSAMSTMVLAAAVEASLKRLSVMKSAADVCASDEASVVLPADIDRDLGEVEGFLLDRVYRTPEIVRMDEHGRKIVLDLFDAYRKDQSRLPQRFAQRVDDQGVDRVTCDYIAGMTDRFCEATHKDLCSG